MKLPLAPPAGMRDLLFPASDERRALARRLVEAFARHGYELVVTPPFEHAEVIERGIETAIRDKVVTYDLARQMEGATEVKCSEFAEAVVERM